MHKQTKTPAIVLGTALTLGLGAGTAAADVNPFTLTDLGSGYMVAAEGSCGSKSTEGSCGSNAKKAEGSCGSSAKSAEGSCGAKEKSAEGSCGSKSEQVAQPKSGEGKCGEGKSGTKG